MIELKLTQKLTAVSLCVQLGQI